MQFLEVLLLKAVVFCEHVDISVEGMNSTHTLLHLEVLTVSLKKRKTKLSYCFIRDQLLYFNFPIQLYFTLTFKWVCFLFTLIWENMAWVSKYQRYLKNIPRFNAGSVPQTFFFFFQIRLLTWKQIYPSSCWHLVVLRIALYILVLPEKPLNVWGVLVNMCQKTQSHNWKTNCSLLKWCLKTMSVAILFFLF